MKQATTIMDKLVILCKNIQKTSSIYCQSLGLKMVMQSPQLVQLVDTKNLHIYLKSVTRPSQMSKGYSPIISFKVEYFDEVREKLLRAELVQDGDVIHTQIGKLANFQGPEGQHISINDFKEEMRESEDRLEDDLQDKSSKQIKNILNKIKI